MTHPIYRVMSFKIVAPYTLQVEFDDHTSQTIDFWPILAGELYGPLRDLSLFNKARIDAEVHTIVWPNGADFDPATLHDWPGCIEGLRMLSEKWFQAAASHHSQKPVHHNRRDHHFS